MKRFVWITALTLALAGCLGYPLNMTQGEWLDLTPEQRVEARAEQSRINAERDADLARQEAAEQKRVANLHANGQRGDIVQCVIEGGTIEVGGKALAHEPLAFALARGERRYVTIESASGTREIWATFRRDGLKISFCPYNPGYTLHSGCLSVAAVSRDLAKGRSWPFAIESIVEGATLRCALPLERTTAMVK